MIFLFEAVPESIVHRYFLQVPALLNLPVPGFAYASWQHSGGGYKPLECLPSTSTAPEGAPAVGAARCGRGEVLEGRKVKRSEVVSNSADGFHSVLGVFGFFCAARGPGRSLSN
jgi:hypothetical protein